MAVRKDAKDIYHYITTQTKGRLPNKKVAAPA